VSLVRTRLVFPAEAIKNLRDDAAFCGRGLAGLVAVAWPSVGNGLGKSAGFISLVLRLKQRPVDGDRGRTTRSSFAMAASERANEFIAIARMWSERRSVSKGEWTPTMKPAQRLPANVEATKATCWFMIDVARNRQS